MSTKRNGLYANGRQRWFCGKCRRSFCWNNKIRKRQKESIWFERWITEGYSVRQLSGQSGHSEAKLRQIIDGQLKLRPPEPSAFLEGHRYLVFDGSFLGRPTTIVGVMDAATHRIIAGGFNISESSTGQLKAFFEPLKAKGLAPVSFTTDGSPAVLRALNQLWPEAALQRCLVHIQRQGLVWCRQIPRRPDAKRLRRIFLAVTCIDTKEQRDRFQESVWRWEERYGRLIAGQPERGRVFSDLKRARSMLLNALPNMFHYLDDPGIPKTTNGIEGYFSRMKGHYRNHRGLAKDKREKYFLWYFHLRPR